MFEVHCDELIRGLCKRAENLKEKLLQRMMKDHQFANKRLGHFLASLMSLNLIYDFAITGISAQR